jgi:CRP-like cAMP-binding protein
MNRSRTSTQEFEEIKKVLGTCPLFAWLESEHIDMLSASAEERIYKAREVVFLKGTEAHMIGVIAEGEVQFISGTGEMVERTVSSLATGDYFGELCLFENRLRQADIMTLTTSKIYVIKRNIIAEFAENYPDQYAIVLTNLARELARRLRKLNRQKTGENSP